MPRFNRTTVMLCSLLLTAVALTSSMGCGNKDDSKPPSGAGYYSGDDFHGNAKGKASGFHGEAPAAAKSSLPTTN
jgi:hypothetical protein